MKYIVGFIIAVACYGTLGFCLWIYKPDYKILQLTYMRLYGWCTPSLYFCGQTVLPDAGLYAFPEERGKGNVVITDSKGVQSSVMKGDFADWISNNVKSGDIVHLEFKRVVLWNGYYKNILMYIDRAEK